MELEIEIYDLSRSGPGVGKDPEGRIVFVPFTTPGDIVRVAITGEEKRYLEGEVISFVKKSPNRVEPKCSAFSICGGCDWQHVPYAQQWSTKLKGLSHSLLRVGAITDSIPWEELPADQIWGYRNRIQIRGRSGEVGFHQRQKREFAPIELCWIARDELNAELPLIREKGKALAYPYKVELEVFPDGSVSSSWNSGHATHGFRQIHDEQNAKLVNWVAGSLRGAGVLLDLFGGTGNLSLGIADRFEKVICVDLARDKSGSSYPANFELVRSPVHLWLSKNAASLAAAHSAISVVLDPPRMGFGPEFTEIIRGLEVLKAQEILLIGCDPDSWARNVQGLQKKGYALESLGALDFFPQTKHIEALARFRKTPIFI